jgi:hypothetical protein
LAAQSVQVELKKDKAWVPFRNEHAQRASYGIKGESGFKKVS